MKAFLDRHFELVVLLLSFSLLLLTFNNKSYLLVFLLFGSILFIRGYDLIKILFYTLLLSLPFERGLRAWHIPIVFPGPETWMTAYYLYFGIAVKYLISFALLLVFFSSRNKFKLQKKNKTTSLLLLFLSLSLISTVLATRFDIAALGFFRLIYIGWLFILSKNLFSTKAYRIYFLKFATALLLFLGFIGSLQFITRQPLGLFLEDQLTRVPFGVVTHESDLIYRTSGLIGHPTFFGSYLSLLIPISLGIVLERFSKNRPKINLDIIIVSSSLIFGALAIFGTFSRSSWLAMFGTIITFLIIWWRLTAQSPKKSKILLGLIVGLGTLFVTYSSLLILRLKSFAYIWSLGSGRGRLILISRSWEMIKDFPLFGAGLNHFTYQMTQQNLTPEARGFMYPVHNTFLLFFSELGVPAGVLFIAFIGVILTKSYHKTKRSWVTFGIWLGAFTFLINAQFHPLFNHDPALDLFMVLLAFLTVI